MADNQNSYKILGDLFLGLPNTPYKESFQKLGIDTGEATEDDLASHHYQTFGLAIFPFGHYFLSEEGNFGGDEVNDIVKFYHQND